MLPSGSWRRESCSREEAAASSGSRFRRPHLVGTCGPRWCGVFRNPRGGCLRPLPRGAPRQDPLIVRSRTKVGRNEDSREGSTSLEIGPDSRHSFTDRRNVWKISIACSDFVKWILFDFTKWFRCSMGLGHMFLGSRRLYLQIIVAVICQERFGGEDTAPREGGS